MSKDNSRINTSVPVSGHALISDTRALGSYSI